MTDYDVALYDALTTMEGQSMTSQDKAPKIREVVVANDPTNHGALIGRVDASQFPSVVRMASATYHPVPILTTFSAHLTQHAPL